MRMKSVMAKSVLAFAVVLPLIAAGPAAPADLSSPAGLWQAVDDDTKQPTGWFLITNHDGVYAGIIAKMFMKPGENPNVVCDQCKDDRFNHPWLGLEIIRDMKQEEADKYGGGNILDPRDGEVWRAKMTVSPDGQELTLRGYVLTPLLGKNEIWQRLPDSQLATLDPSVIAKYVPAQAVSVKPAAGSAKKPAPPKQ